MDKKKILIVSRSFYPQNSPRSFRTTELAKEFAKQGHEVTVMTIKTEYTYNQFEIKHNLTVLDLIKSRKNERDLFSTKRGLITRIKDRFLYQFLLYPEIKLAFLVKKVLINHQKEYDLLVSIAKPYSAHFGCAMALRKNKQLTKCWVSDCGDPFSPSSDPYSFPFYIKKFERWMFGLANYVSIPVETALPAYPAVAQKKAVIIPQGFNFEDVKIDKSFEKNEVPTFAYAGAFYNKIRSPEKLLRFLSTLNKDFKFVFFTGSTNYIEPFFPILKDKIEIRNVLPRQELLFELSKMDFLVNIENTDREMVPSKFIDYALTKRPILSLHPENFDPELVVEFINGNYENQFIVKNLEKYNIKNVAPQFLNLTS